VECGFLLRSLYYSGAIKGNSGLVLKKYCEGGAMGGIFEDDPARNSIRSKITIVKS
jgi:hypothetical protein